MSNFKFTDIGKYEPHLVIMREHYTPVMHEFYCALYKGKPRLAAEISEWIKVHYEMHAEVVIVAVHAEDSETEEDHPRITTRPHMTKEMLYENLFNICETNVTYGNSDFTFGKIMRFFTKIQDIMNEHLL